jgi:hypothetical protein
MLRELLAERGRDISDGLTLRSIDRRLTDHSSHDDRMWDRVDDRLRAVEQATARGAAHDDFVVPTPGAFAPIVINPGVNGGTRSKRPSIPSIVRVATKPALQWLAIVALIVASHLLAKCGVRDLPPIPPVGHLAPAQ